MEAKVYNKEGKEVGVVTLPESVFGAPWNADLVHQVVVSMEGNARTPVAHTKGRGDVAGGGAKPWRQKGTGRARHGSIRSPIWRGGGVTFGPRNEKNYKRKINAKMRTRALFSALSQKFREGEVLFVERIDTTEPKTRDAKQMLASWSAAAPFEHLNRRRNAALIALAGRDENTAKSFRNFSNIFVDEVRNLNPREVLKYRYVIISEPEKAITALESRSKKKK